MAITLQTFKLGRSTKSVTKDAATVITANTFLAYDANGLAVAATSSTTRDQLIGLAIESIAAADALTTVTVLELDQNDEFLADVTNNSNTAHTGDLMVLSSAGVVNNTGTTAAAGLVQQIATVGAAADKQILCKIAKLV